MSASPVVVQPLHFGPPPAQIALLGLALLIAALTRDTGRATVLRGRHPSRHLRPFPAGVRGGLNS